MPLTWRNVDAPDFSSSLNGIRTFSDLFTGAIGSARQGLDRYDASIDKRVNSEFAMNLLKYQDPAAYKEALASGTLFEGVDPNRISSANVQAAGTRGTDLLNQKVAEFGLTRDEYSFGRTKDRNSKLDAAEPFIAGAYAAAAQGKEAYDKYVAANPSLRSLPFEQAVNLATGAQEAEMKGVGIAGGRLGNIRSELGIDMDRWGFGNQKQDRQFMLEDRANQKAATALLAQLPFSVDNAADLERAFNTPQFRSLSPEAQLAVRTGAGSLMGMSGGSGGGGDSSLGGGPGIAGDPSRIMNYEARAAGFSIVPDNVRTLGQAVEFGRQVNKAGANSSAMGLFQITRSTLEDFAPRVLGANWKDQPFDANSQDKIGEAIFNASKGSAAALSGRWVSLSPMEAERVRQMPWSQAREIIAGKESGASAAQLRGAQQGSRFNSRSATVELADRVGALTSQNPTANSYPTTALDTKTDIATATASLIGKGGVFEGTNRGVMLTKVRDIVNKAGVTPATAAEIIKNSVAQSDNGTLNAVARRLSGGLIGGGPNLGGGVRIDQRLLDAEIKNATSGNLVKTAVANMTNQDTLGGQQSAQANYEAALGAYQTRLMRRADKPGLSIDREAAQLRAAEQALMAATGMSRQTVRELGTSTRPDAPRPIAVARPVAPAAAAIARAASGARSYRGPLSAKGESIRSKWERALQQ